MSPRPDEMSPRPDDPRSAPLARLAALMREASPGEVPPEEHRAGREALLAALDRRAALPPRPRRWMALATAAAVAVALALLIAWPARRITVVHVDGGAIAAGGYLAPEAARAAAVRFSDGSVLTLLAGGRGRIAELDARGARVVLEDGAARVTVTPRPGATWSVEAGPFAIAVTGTAFDVSWSASAQELTVRMREGSVLVRGPMAPAGVPLVAGQQLTARVATGDLRIEVAALEDAAAQAQADPAGGGAPALSATSPTADPPGSIAPPRPGDLQAAPQAGEAAPSGPPASWAERVAAGDFAAVVADAEARGIDAITGGASLADLVALADAARYARRMDIARRALEAQRARFRGTPAAATATFLLGRIADDAQSAHGAAIALYDQYLAEAPGGAFAAEALGRKMVALSRSGRPEAARVAAEEILRRHPRSSYAAAARSLIDERPLPGADAGAGPEPGPPAREEPGPR